MYGQGLLLFLRHKSKKTSLKKKQRSDLVISVWICIFYPVTQRRCPSCALCKESFPSLGSTHFVFWGGGGRGAGLCTAEQALCQGFWIKSALNMKLHCAAAL